MVMSLDMRETQKKFVKNFFIHPEKFQKYSEEIPERFRKNFLNIPEKFGIVKTFPEIAKFPKLFRDKYRRINRNIQPCSRALHTKGIFQAG